MNFEELLVAALKRQGFGALDAEEIADWYLGMPETPFPANFQRAVLAANGYDPSQPRNADGEWTAGGGAPHAATGKAKRGSHTPEQQKRIDEYAAAVDDKALSWRARVLALDGEAQKREFFQFGISDARMAADVKAKTGIDTNGWPVKMQGNHAVHIEQRHGASGAADHSMADPKDFARIGYALKNYDSIEVLPDNQGYRNRDNGPARQIEFRTRIDGTMAVQTVVPDTKRRTLFITSTRIEKRKDEHL